MVRGDGDQTQRVGVLQTTDFYTVLTARLSSHKISWGAKSTFRLAVS